MQAHIRPQTGPQTHGSSGQAMQARQVQGFAGIVSVSGGLVAAIIVSFQKGQSIRRIGHNYHSRIRRYSPP
jgi:hypothetical protein